MRNILVHYDLMSNVQYYYNCTSLKIVLSHIILLYEVLQNIMYRIRMLIILTVQKIGQLSAKLLFYIETYHKKKV